MAGKAGDMDWVYLNAGSEADVRIGELISADAGGLPIYRVVAVKGDRAWLKDLKDDSDHVTLLSAFHWKALPNAAA